MISGIFGDSADTPEPPSISGGASHPQQAFPNPTEPSPFAPPPAMPSPPPSSPVAKPSSPDNASPAAESKLDPDIGILITGCQEGETSADIRPSKGTLCLSSVWYWYDSTIFRRHEYLSEMSLKECASLSMMYINSLSLCIIQKIGHVTVATFHFIICFSSGKPHGAFTNALIAVVRDHAAKVRRA